MLSQICDCWQLGKKAFLDTHYNHEKLKNGIMFRNISKEEYKMFQIQNLTLNAKQAAQYVGVSYWTLLSLARQGQIKHFRGGNKLLFRQKSLDEWMASGEEASIRQSK
jgi:excisionase family DNA binding protein